jgi:2-polyprenyl-6-methoxyphenol hydroxylase-like FAD-dependent oxidoreductase
MEMSHVLIAGGGIGGIAAALALDQRGFEVFLYEQAPELHELGAGVTITPKGSRTLEQRSIVPSACAISSSPTPTWRLHSWTGSSRRPDQAISVPGFTNTMH